MQGADSVNFVYGTNEFADSVFGFIGIVVVSVAVVVRAVSWMAQLSTRRAA